ncbi:MAG: sigma-70 family RNA polymerase sigma factor [Bacilli bacterium]|nr:sigma-70 family RNA polymerase sigma factor [Bacilli bacterium]
MSKYKVDITGINTNELKVLKNEEMIELFKRYQDGDLFAKEDIINGNLKLVLSIIKKYNTGKYDMNDLFQIGCIGLIKAVDNFDMSFGVMFSTYAVPLILGEVKRFIRDSTQVRVARSIRDNALKILKFKDEYLLKNGIEPTNDEICESLEMTPYDLELSLNSLKEPMSIFEPIYNDGGDTIYLADQIADIKNTNEDRDNLLSLRRALMKIKDRERNILTDRYIVGKTQSEIANELGVSQAQVSRIEKSAINNVKRLIK